MSFQKYKTAQLTKTLRGIETIKKVLSENLSNEYDRGLYNGLELAISLLLDKPRKFAVKKDKKHKSKTTESLVEATIALAKNGFIK